VAIIRPRDLGSSHCIDKIFSESVCIWVELNMLGITFEPNSLIFLFIYLYCQIILDPTIHVATNLKPQNVCEDGPSKNVILNFFDSAQAKTGKQPFKI
jgi:hypothetical protein